MDSGSEQIGGFLGPFRREFRELREMMKLNQKQAADAIGAEQSTISKFETAKGTPESDTLDKLWDLKEKWRNELGVPSYYGAPLMWEDHKPEAGREFAGTLTRCPVCTRLTPETYPRCAQCGSLLSLKCPCCGFDNSEVRAHFCTRCLHPLTDKAKDLVRGTQHVSEMYVDELIENLKFAELEALRERQEKGIREATKKQAKQKPFDR